MVRDHQSMLKRLERMKAVPPPVRRAMEITWTLVNDLGRCDLLKQASAMAYVTLLSLIPSLIAVFCVISIFSPLGGQSTAGLIADLKDYVLRNLAAGSGEAAVQYLDRLVSGMSLATIGWSSLASMIVTLALLLRQIEGALNRIWMIHRGRHVLTRFLYFWTFLSLGVLVIAITIGVTSGYNVRDLVRDADDARDLRFLSKSLIPLAGSTLFFFVVFKIVPNCHVKARNAGAGALLAALCLHQGSRLYGLYVKNAPYQTLYGALAQLPIFLLWLYICWIIILLGALLSWRLQEGFPTSASQDTLDDLKTPADAVRNAHIRTALPLLALLAVGKEFQGGRGRGVSGQDLAHAWRLPLHWVGEALDVLEAEGLIVASKGATREKSLTEASASDPFFPAVPLASITLAKVRADLGQPLRDWLEQRRDDLSMNVANLFLLLDNPQNSSKSLEELVATLPPLDLPTT